ncbi:IS701 family transposase [Saccharothrix tamanrassetensis]|uniref:IS701 family transposase n=1 Tax=Saccharothrix tamanrassetensis TaxID=1051531 RepID=UPI00406BA9B4
MSEDSELYESVILHDSEHLSRFCQDFFMPLTRSDQRRWAEMYVRGLIYVPGRKSIRRISDHVVGWRADQCLQQFVNQSPWRWEPVRLGLARHLVSEVTPRAWVVQEAVFPKNGDSSVGVAKQYVSSARRTLNCQLGLAVFMACHESSFPVNWRLMLPRCWDDDDKRRARTHVPADERHRHRWSYLLEALDEMVGEWSLTPPPVLVDARHEIQVEQLVQGLEERGLSYVVQVGPDTPAVPAANRSSERQVTVEELVTLSARRGRMTVHWGDRADGGPAGSHFVAATVPGRAGAGPVRIVPGAPYPRLRRVLAEWPSGRVRPSSVWLTNLDSSRMSELIGLVRLPGRTNQDLTRLQCDFGLRHFEGRSFRGWHHHVTLASVAHAYSTLNRQRQRQPEMSLRPYA